MTKTSSSIDPKQTTLRRINLPKIVGVLILKTPALVVRCGGEFLRFKSMARKAGRIFQAELEHQGIEHATAQRLQDAYRSGIDTSRLLRSFR